MPLLSFLLGQLLCISPPGGGVPVPPLPIHWYYIMAAGGALLLLAVAILVRALCCCRQHLATKKSQLSVAYHSSSQCFQYSNWSSSMAAPGVEPVLTVRLDSRDRHRTLCWEEAVWQHYVFDKGRKHVSLWCLQERVFCFSFCFVFLWHGEVDGTSLDARANLLLCFQLQLRHPMTQTLLFMNCRVEIWQRMLLLSSADLAVVDFSHCAAPEERTGLWLSYLSKRTSEHCLAPHYPSAPPRMTPAWIYTLTCVGWKKNRRRRRRKRRRRKVGSGVRARAKAAKTTG